MRSEATSSAATESSEAAESSDAAEADDGSPFEPELVGRSRRRPDESPTRPSDVSVADGETAVVTERATRRWVGVGVLALVGIGVGVITGTAPPLLAAGVALAFTGYGALASVPDIDLAVQREIANAAPDPGDEVRITVTVTNEGDRTLADCRLLDRVPTRLGVVSGSARRGAVLRPGHSTEFSYTVRAERGDFTFDGLTVIVRDVSGATERVAVIGERDSLTALAPSPSDPPSFPLREKTANYTGTFAGDAGGPGIEFYSTREYRSGDPLNRVDWNRMARTGELTTVEFRVERTVRVALVFDTRRSAHLAPTPDSPSVVERAVDGGVEVYASLTQDGHAVAISALAPIDCWLPSGAGDRHRVQARQILGTHAALSPEPPKAETNIYQATQRLKGRLAADEQVVLFTPLHDDLILDTIIRLEAYGFAITVVSPDPTTDDTAGHNYARVDRRLRIADLRGRGIPVIDWQPAEDLGHALARSERRWSA